MADSHEEQLLTALLGGIAREDERLAAPHLEARVLAAAGTEEIPRRRPMAPYLVIAAALVSAVIVPVLYRTPSTPAGAPVNQDTAITEVAIPDKSAQPPVVEKTPVLSTAAPIVESPIEQSALAPSPMADSPVAQSPIAQSPIAQSPVTHSPDEFIPLMPITAQELTGSFQIVRVQMPRASLGVLRSALEQPNELVEADVLLGEDGMARGIRLAVSGSVSPWRSR
jgi:hypothetical protein